MRKSLENTIKSVGLAGALSLAGCTTLMDNFNENFGPTSKDYNRPNSNPGGEAVIAGSLLGVLGVQKNNPSAIVAGQNLVQYGSAQAGKSEVHIDITGHQPAKKIDSEKVEINYSPDKLPQSSSAHILPFPDDTLETMYFVTCNFAKDFGNDGNIDYPADYNTIKDTFSSNERITIVGSFTRKLEGLKYNLYNSDGDIISEKTRDREANSIEEVFPAGKLKAGTYTAVWYSGEKFLHKAQFTIEK